MIIRKIFDLIKRFHKPLRVFLSVGFFLLALDSCIAVNRWWFEEGNAISFMGYLHNLTFMVLGFAFFTIFASKSKLEVIGYGFFCIALYFICNYEIGGYSKYYLTPFDPLFGLPQTFAKGDQGSLLYRNTMAYLMSISSALVLAISKVKSAKNKTTGKNQPIG